MPTFDFLIVGGGPAGTLTALQLSIAGARVALLQWLNTQKFALEMLSGRARRVIEGRVGSLLEIASAKEIDETISLWDTPIPVCWSSIGDPWGAGVSVDRLYFDEFLRSSAKMSHVSVFGLRQPGWPEKRGGLWRLIDRDCSLEIAAPFLIQAAGRSGASRPKRKRFCSFSQLALTVHLPQQVRRSRTSFCIEKTQDGWWYLIPGASENYFIAFCTKPEQLKSRQIPPAEFFRDQFEHTKLIASLVMQSVSPLPVVARLASEITFDCVAGEDWIAVGDAAYACDPLSGRGVEFAADSAEAAVRALTRFSNRAGLADYQCWVDEYVQKEIGASARYRD